MKRIIGLIVTLLVCTVVLAGCKPKALEPLSAGVLKEPAKEKVSAHAQAYIDVLDYAIKDFANREENVKNERKYLSINLKEAKFLTDKDRADVQKYLSGYGIPLDDKGIDSGRTIKEQQQGFEIKVVENANTDFYDREGTDMVLQVMIYMGPNGRGYFGSFREHGDEYVMTYMYNNMVYQR